LIVAGDGCEGWRMETGEQIWSQAGQPMNYPCYSANFGNATLEKLFASLVNISAFYQ